MGILPSSRKKYKEQMQEQMEEQARQHAEKEAAALRQNEALQREIEEREKKDLERRQLETAREEKRAYDAEIKRWNDEQEKLREQDRVNMQMARLRNTSPESLRRLRELIRARYYLDVSVWGLRGVYRADQGLVMEKGRRADAILQEIYSIVDTWDENTFTPDEWRVARKIKELVFLPDKRIWEKDPPWS